ncbi:MAG: hypothetical protein HC908_01690 [Calothrix sp. SM1_7_51]|nr:hypothetical protein [Calothrix sp. SM1_7_51]
MNDKLYNRPGLSALSYRVGDWASFRHRMLVNLPLELGNPDNPGNRPLYKLNTRAGDDAAIALLDAWAVVSDVLTFYQERIANEGYINTAVEQRSVVELSRSIGYELSPGVAASTFLAFTVDETSASTSIARVPKGTQIVSIPQGDEKPQTFETDEEIVARAEWNALKPRLTKPQEINSKTDKLILQGIATQIQPGDRLLLIDAEQTNSWLLLTVMGVKVVVEGGYTKITWKQEKRTDFPDSVFRKPQVFAFRQKAALFGYNAPKWEDMPDDVKRDYGGTVKGGISHTISNNGLPAADIRSLTLNHNGQLFAGCEGRGVFSYQANEKKWIPVNTGLTNLNIQTLSVDENGYLFAGTSAGGIFSSKDNGESWAQLNLGSIGVKSTSSTTWESVNTGLPNTVVRSIISFYTRFEDINIGNINSNGVTVTGINDSNIQQLRVGDIITADGQSKIIININITATNNTLTVDTPFSSNLSNKSANITGGNCIFVGTDEGIYRSYDQGKNWLLKPSFRIVIRDLVTYRVNHNRYILQLLIMGFMVLLIKKISGVLESFPVKLFVR